ncbi:MAG: hypothetical protein CVV23_09150 [Ignavibacteriae bacterium HGW-Ignavibacteriae-2]|nr:MAG: hypothetical protein CVV23_09150 [Ignavibacteriae bacterium HGW-Ignavibacteriae-2]
MKKFTIFLFLFVCSWLSAQTPEWEWLNPLPTGVSLNAVYAPSENTVWAFGDVSALLTTKDGGITAVVNYIDPQQRDLIAVSFASANVGYTVGEDGLMMKTINGGLSWSAINHTMGDLDFYSVGAASEQVVYVGASSGKLFKTADGGTTWTELNSGVTKTIYTIDVVSPNNIYAATASGGGLIQSKNEGATWTNVTPAGLTKTVKTIDFIDAANGWVAEDTNYKIFATKDSGKTWTSVALTDKYSITKILFVDNQTGFLVNAAGNVLKSIDGGATWSNPINLTINDFYDLTYVKGTNVLYAVGRYGVIAKTTDLGATWTNVSTAVYEEDFRVCKFFDEKNGMVAGGATSGFGNILLTNDGGDSWTAANYNLGSRVYGVATPTRDIWYVARQSSNLIAKTTDCGATFVEQATPLASATKHFYDVEFPNENFGMAVRSGGEIIKTEDGGANWVELATPTTKAIYAVTVLNNQNAFICGSGAFRTTDGGTTWEEMDIKIPGTFFSMNFYGDKLGYIAGYSGGYPQLTKTTDGGNTWNAINFPTDFDRFGSVWAIEIINPHAVWLGLINGDMLYSEDGGDTWNEYPRMHKSTIFGISAVGKKMYQAGNGAIIMKSSIPANLVDIEPSIVAVEDVADDQGGKVRLTIKASSNDTPVLNKIVSYSVWRENTSGLWDAIGSFSALQTNYYYYVAPTLGDSTVDAVTWSKFYVTAHTASPKLYYLSDAASGYSIDNIAPNVPGGFVAKLGDAIVELNWEISKDLDFRYFEIYRSTEENFDPTTADPIAVLTKNLYSDNEVSVGTKYYYKLAAVDFAGNRSEYTSTISALVTGAENVMGMVPEDYTISQNYPNPFNPSTTIKYGVPEESNVKVTIYNTLGEVVLNVVNTVQRAGYHVINWNASNVPSGIYFYSIEANPLSGGKGFKASMKMMLIK